MLGDRVALLDRHHVLAEPGELAGDPLGLEARGGIERARRVLAGHEPAHRATGEPESREVIAQPAVPGHPEEQPTHQQQPTAAGLAILDG